MFFSKRIINGFQVALCASILLGGSHAVADTSALQERVKLARMEAEQALNLFNRYQGMATEARELVYKLPVEARPDASRRADVLARSAERANATYTRLSTWADQLDRQLASSDIARADQIAAVSGEQMRLSTPTQPAVNADSTTHDAAVSYVRAPSAMTDSMAAESTNTVSMVQPVQAGGHSALTARASAEEAKAYSNQVRRQLQEAKANLMAFDASPGQIDASLHQQTRDQVRSLTQEAKIAAWQYRDLELKAANLEAQ